MPITSCERFIRHWCLGSAFTYIKRTARLVFPNDGERVELIEGDAHERVQIIGRHAAQLIDRLQRGDGKRFDGSVLNVVLRLATNAVENAH